MVAPKIEAVEDPEGKFFRIIVDMPRQTILLDDWQSMIWDECLRQAHERLLMPVGPVFVGDPTELPPDIGGVELKLQEGSRINVQAFMEGFGMPAQVSVDMVRVEAEVALMGSMQ